MKLIDRAKAIIINPKTEWNLIAREESNPRQLITSYLFPLALIPAIAGLIGYGFIGYNIPFVGHVGSLSMGIRQAIIMLITMIGGALLTAFIIDALAPSFGTIKNFNKALQLVVYSYTPTLVAGVFYIYPSLGILVMIAGIYGLYILYQGLKPLMQAPDEKVTGYFVVSLLVLIGVYFIISAVLSAIFIKTMIPGI